MKKTSSSKKTGKILGSALVGAVLGVATGMLLAPKSGKNIRKDIMKVSGDFYKHISPQLKKLKATGGAQYVKVVEEGAKKFAKLKKLSVKEEKVLVRVAKDLWKDFKKSTAR